MWTPRRVALGLSGLVVVAALYFGYARILGNFDGLPPLPDRFEDVPGERPYIELPPGTNLDRKLEMAFGQGCPELRFPIKVEMKEKGVILASYAFKIIQEGSRAGWVELSPLSVAVFGKKRGADGIPEINTLYGDMAFIKFDRPIKALADMDGRRVVAAELHADQDAKLSDARKGRIRIQNNRRTLDPNDDIELITPGPVYYDDQPKPGQPHIYTFTAVQGFDYLNTGLPAPDRTVPCEPTVSGEGLRVFLTPEDKDKKKAPVRKPGEPVLGIPGKDKPGLSGVDLVVLDHTVEMNLWTDSNTSFVAPGGDKQAKKDPKPPAGPKKGQPTPEKRRLQVRTNGPFRYDLTKELAHFEKPAAPRPGVVEDQHVTVTRAGRTTGQELLDCEYLDIQFQRKKLPPPPKDAPPPPPRKDSDPGDGDLEIKLIRAWGETVVMTSDAENLHATGAELIHDADARMTILKGNAEQQVQVVKDGNLLRGSELHLFGDGKEISQGHVLGAGSIGMGDLDPKTGEYQKQAFWTDRMVFNRETEKGKPTADVLTFLGKDGGKARFRDTSNNQVQEIEAFQLKVFLKPAEKEDEKDKAGKKAPPKKREPQKKEGPDADITKGARPTRMEAIGEVRSTSPDVVIKHADSLIVEFRDVPKLLKPPPEPKEAKDPKSGPASDPANPKIERVGAKAEPPAKKAEPKKEDGNQKKPLVVSARRIESTVNRDPKGQNELDHVRATGNVEAHQDPATKDEQGTDVAGETVELQAYADGDRLAVTGIPSAQAGKEKWGVVRFDKLTMFGFDIVIDQRTNTSAVKGEGSMEILAATDMEGKKLEKPTMMTIYWKHKMDFFGTDKLIYYHGAVQAYQEASRLKCEWMQVVLDRPVYLNQAMKPKPPPKKLKPGEKKEDDNPKIETVMCFHAPKDEDVPKPRTVQPVTVVEEVKENGKTVRFQSLQGPDVVTVNTPVEGQKPRHDIIVTSSDTMPGTVRIWQPGPKDALAEKPEPRKDDPKKKDKEPPKKKGELSADEEMKLTVVQFAGKMIANDLRKRAKFFTNIRVVHLAADSPFVPVDLREGEIPKGAVYLECRDTLEVFSTPQKEKDPKTGKPVDVNYQEMIAIGNVRVRKQGEFYGDADKVTYSELKGTLTFHGSEKNPAEVHQQQGPGVRDKPLRARTIIYNVKSKTFETIGATELSR